MVYAEQSISDISDTLAIDAESRRLPDWKAFAKQRLADLVARFGSQRKFAKMWLGNESRSPSVNQWISPDRQDFPGVNNLILLRENCGVSLDWLFGVPSRMPESWTPERGVALSDDLSDYFFALIIAPEDFRGAAGVRDGFPFEGRSAELGARARRTPSTAIRVIAEVTVEAGGDFLAYFTRTVSILVSQVEDRLSLEADHADAERWRAHVRAQAKDVKPTTATPTEEP